MFSPPRMIKSLIRPVMLNEPVAVDAGFVAACAASRPASIAARSRLRVVVVALHHVVAAHAEFAALATGSVDAVSPDRRSSPRFPEAPCRRSAIALRCAHRAASCVMPGDDSVSAVGNRDLRRGASALITRRISGSGHSAPAMTPVRSDGEIESSRSPDARARPETSSARRRAPCSARARRSRARGERRTIRRSRAQAPCVNAPSTPMTQPKQ